MIEKYFEPFYLQECKETASNMPPPHDKPIKKLADGKLVMGLFVLQNTREGQQAQAHTTNTSGRFSCSIDEPIESGSILCRASDGKFFSVTGDGIKSPGMAISQIAVYPAEIADRNKIGGEA